MMPRTLWVLALCMQKKPSAPAISQSRNTMKQIAALLIFAMMTGSSFAETAAPPEAPSTTSAEGKSSDVEQLQREFDTQRKELLEQRKAALERLRQAKTDEERNRIVEEMRRQQQDRLDKQRELMRQIRERLQTERRTRPGR